MVHQAPFWQGSSKTVPPPSQLPFANILAQQQGDNWNDLLKQVITFNSVEEFWGIYVSTPSDLALP